MRCLVTGVAGFVGSHLADRLLADGHEVCGIDAFTPNYPRSFKERNLETSRAAKRFTLIEGNMLDLPLPDLLVGVDWIFHEAAEVGVRTSWGIDFARYVDYNILATQKLLDAALTAQSIKRFVYASSSSIYGEAAALPVSESALPEPVSPYGVTKLAGEQLCTLYQRNSGLPVVSLRYFTVYGPRQRPDMAIHRFFQALLQRKPVSIYGDGEQTRDFTYISDVVEANIRSATCDTAPGHIFNIAGGSSVKIAHLVQLVQESAGISGTIQFASTQPGDAHNTCADIRQAAQVLNYQPAVSLREGLAEECAYIRRMYEQPW